MDTTGYRVCSLERAQQAILQTIRQLPCETVGLQDALRRITASDVRAEVFQPLFDESIRDGYVLPASGKMAEGRWGFEIVGEIPAGKATIDTLEPLTACKIMTGGCLPKGADRVLPFENCAEHNGWVFVEEAFLRSTKTFIKRAGSEIARGDLLVPGGEQLAAAHLALIASCGANSVSVATRPSVGFLCTGSELTVSSNRLEKGQKFSSNSFLLEGGIRTYGGSPGNLGIIQDHPQDLFELFAVVKAGEWDMVISTGGMGPGKYDLVEQEFIDAGGNIVFDGLDMRPGASLLLGTLGRTVFFGLPGPPAAVRTLFNMLVGPALKAMQGVKNIWPKKLQAYSQSEINIKRNDVLRLKDGVLAMEGGKCYVRFAERFEIPNCYIAISPGQTFCREGALVDVYSIGVSG